MPAPQIYDMNTLPAASTVGQPPDGMTVDSHASVQSAGWLAGLPLALLTTTDSGSAHQADTIAADDGGGEGTWEFNIRAQGAGNISVSRYRGDAESVTWSGATSLAWSGGGQTVTVPGTGPPITSDVRIRVVASAARRQVEVYDRTLALYQQPDGSFAAGQAYSVDNSAGTSGTNTAGVYGYQWYPGTTGSIVQAFSTLQFTPITPTATLSASTLSIGQTGTATSTGATGSTVTWTSSNTAVATINASTGVYTAVGAGTCAFTATGVANTTQVGVTGTLTVSSGTTILLIAGGFNGGLIN